MNVIHMTPEVRSMLAAWKYLADKHPKEYRVDVNRYGVTLLHYCDGDYTGWFEYSRYEWKGK